MRIDRNVFEVAARQNGNPHALLRKQDGTLNENGIDNGCASDRRGWPYGKTDTWDGKHGIANRTTIIDDHVRHLEQAQARRVPRRACFGMSKAGDGDDPNASLLSKARPFHRHRIPPGIRNHDGHILGRNRDRLKYVGGEPGSSLGAATLERACEKVMRSSRIALTGASPPGPIERFGGNEMRMPRTESVDNSSLLQAIGHKRSCLLNSRTLLIHHSTQDGDQMRKVIAERGTRTLSCGWELIVHFSTAVEHYAICGWLSN